MAFIFNSLPESPLITFTILLLVSLTIPPVFEKLRLPGLVGLLVAGVALGPDGLQLLHAGSETMKLLTDIGKIYLMFVAGLEIDLAEFRRQRHHALGFGLATFALPLGTGTAIAHLFGFGANAAVAVGSLIASHTLLGYPIVNRLGVARNRAVTATIGATIFTDIAALLVLAICVSIQAGDFSLWSFAFQLGALAGYAAMVLLGFGRAGKEYFRRTGNQQSNQFLLILLAVFLASVGAQIVNIDKIVGAFLAGLAVNDVVGHGPVEEKIKFVGSTLFIPFFFVGMGLLLDLDVFVETLVSELALTLTILGGLLTAKFLAAWLAKFLFHYSWPEALTMWSLSLPQVAATLAATLAGLQAGLLNAEVFNAVIVIMLVTSLAGPLLTESFASRLPLEKTASATDRSVWWQHKAGEPNSQSASEHSQQPFTVVVPVSNPSTERNLIAMAALLAHRQSGQIIPLAIAPAHVYMDERRLNITIRRKQRLLARAVAMSKEFDVEAKPTLRIDDDIAQGISRTAREQNASLIVMGWSKTTVSLRARLFGNLINSVIWSAHCPVAVTRLLDEPTRLKRILVPVKNFTPQAIRAVRFAQLFANTHGASVTFLHVYDPRTPPENIAQFEQEFAHILSQTKLQAPSEIKTIAHDDVAEKILNVSQAFDLVVLRSLRRRTAGGLAVSDVTTRVINELTTSLVLFGEPYS